MSMGEISIFCRLLQFLSSVLYSFPCRGHLYPLLNIFLGILFFLTIVKQNFSYILSQLVHCWCIEMLLIFVHWFCILQICWSCLWCLHVFWWNFAVFCYKIMPSAKRDSLTSSLPICVPLISSSYCIALAGISKTMLCRSGVGTLI
jgi:hypothetical protein